MKYIDRLTAGIAPAVYAVLPLFLIEYRTVHKVKDNTSFGLYVRTYVSFS